MKVYCNDCEHEEIQPLGLCEGAIYWCGAFDEKVDEWYGIKTIHKVKCKKQNKNNGCQKFSHK